MAFVGEQGRVVVCFDKPISIKVSKSPGLTGVNFVRSALISRSAQRRRIAARSPIPPMVSLSALPYSPETPTGFVVNPRFTSFVARGLAYNKTQLLRQPGGQRKAPAPGRRKLVSLCGRAQRSFRPAMSVTRLQPQLYKPAYLERAGQIRQRHRHVQRTYTI